MTVYTNGNGTGAAARKRKRVLQQQQFNWTMEEQVDASGKRREVLVLEDTPPPPPTVIDLDGANGYTNGYFLHEHVSTEPREVKALPRRTARTTKAQAESSNGFVKAEREEVVVQPAKRRRVGAAGEAVVSKKGKAVEDDPWKERKDVSQLLGVFEPVLMCMQPAVPPSCDDKEGHYVITPGDCIGNDHRYKIVRLLGQGTFGKVVEAQDLHSQRRERKVAVKIIRAIQKYRDASKIEVRVLERLKQADPQNIHQCIHAEQVFDFRNHVCIVSELLGMCVYDFLKENEFQPFPRDHIWSFARQLLDSVAFLHTQGLVHTDLKPENILLVNHTSRQICVAEQTRRAPAQYRKVLLDTKIRLIDFGSATFESEYHSSVVSTRHYRAPEIILGMGWSYPCDAYSIGCILVEFYTGTALFQTHDNVEHLAMMEVVMGAMSPTFKNVGRRPEFFKSNGALDWPKARASKASKRDVTKMKALELVINPNKDDANKRFCELVRELLAFDPKSRIRVRDALASGFIKMVPPPEGQKLLARWNGYA
ncbi:kinase-like protein [Calocera viscosa TUFC12733]|uniref:Kinase-like protein n=1 Tax=Calocera viscosa (strain TUFC12733) TaxID=1330018 RepID=A0A167MG14_CALVF|nr:kinase-like protein [Calocera viscosa TUFC12733]